MANDLSSCLLEPFTNLVMQRLRECPRVPEQKVYVSRRNQSICCVFSWCDVHLEFSEQALRKIGFPKPPKGVLDETANDLIRSFLMIVRNSGHGTIVLRPRGRNGEVSGVLNVETVCNISFHSKIQTA